MSTTLIPSLKNTIGTSGQAIETAGYYVAGDCEPLTYRWDDQSTEVDNGVDAAHPGTVIQPTNHSGAGRWLADRPERVNARWFGAKGDGAQNDQPYLQQAINQSIDRADLWPSDVFIPAGNYKLDSALLCKKHTGDFVPRSFSLRLRGEGGFPYGDDVGAITKLVCTFNDTFAIGVQNGKGIRIEKLFILGENPIVLGNAYQAFSRPVSDYVINGCRTNRYSPYSGIVIDPFGAGGGVATGNRYPGFDSHYPTGQGGGGSTDVQIEECRIHAFVCNICVTPNGVTQNAEQIDIRRCRLEQCQVAVAICQSQSRSVRIVDFTCWGNCLYFINGSKYGAGSGTVPYISGGNIAGHLKYLFDSGASVSSVDISQLFCESIYSLGRVTAETTTLAGCMLKWSAPSTDFQTPTTFLHSTKQVNFVGCTLIQSANPPNSKPLLFDVTRLRFYGCTFDVPPQNRTPVPEDIYHDNSIFRHLNGSADGAGDGYTTGGQRLSTLYGNKNGQPLAPGQELAFPSSGYYSLHYRNTSVVPRVEHVEGANVVLTVDAYQNGTFVTNFPERWSTDRGATPVVIWSFVTDEFGRQVYPSASVSSVNGNVVTLGNLPPSLTSGTYQVNIVQPYRWHEPTLGDVEAGSNVIRNVKSFSSVSLAWLSGAAISGQGIPVGSFVVSSDNAAKTITINQNASLTKANVDLFDAPMRVEAASTAPPTTLGWTKGAIVQDSTGETGGWQCVRSGVFGTSQEPLFQPLGLVPHAVQNLDVLSGAVALQGGLERVSVDTEGALPTDDLDTIQGGVANQTLLLRANHSQRTVTLKDGVGNLRLQGDFPLSSSNDTMQLWFDGANWLELTRSTNG